VLPSASAAGPVFADGFESGTMSAWSFASGVQVQQMHVRTGAWAARATANGNVAYAWRGLGSTFSDLRLTARFMLLSQSSTMWVQSLRKPAGTAIALVGVNKNGKLILRNAVAGTTFTSTTIVTRGMWHEIELRTAVGVSGIGEVWFDGNPVADLSRTGNYGTTQIGRVMIGDNTTGKRFDMIIDDVVVGTERASVDGIPPTTPSELVATTMGSSRIDLTWTASTDEMGVAGYTIYRSTDGVGYSQVGTSATTSFSDIGLAAETTYLYAVDAFDAAGNRSLRSNVASATTAAPETRSRFGAWDQPFDAGAVGVHAMMLHTGEVLLVQSRSGTSGTIAKLWDPRNGTMTDASYAAPHNLLCAGMSFLPSGEVFLTGGTLWEGSGATGTAQTALFDPVTRSWRAGPTMGQARWYPTNVSMPDGRVLIFAGKITPTTFADAVERYDPDTDSITTLGPTATNQMAPYPRMFLRPDGNVIRVGTEQRTKTFTPATGSWSNGPLMTTGGRGQGAAVLLTGTDRILAVGGEIGGVTTGSAEILDLASPTPAWRPTASMSYPRKNLTAVLLPDGSVLAVGGNQQGNYDLPVLAPELFDPSSETWTTLASHSAPRAYHSTAVLLPDARVLVAGQTSGTQQFTAEVLSPPYLFQGPRPAIQLAPTEVAYQQPFPVTTADAARISSVVLIRPTAVTHDVNFDQRSLSLPFAASGDSLSVQAPPAADAPPGWYMLFLVDDAGIPSVASWVHLT
jgi:hypothetical protein